MKIQLNALGFSPLGSVRSV